MARNSHPSAPSGGERPIAKRKHPATPPSPPAGRRPSTSRRAAASRPPATGRSGHVVLLSGGNPQIAKADGDAPVQAYLAAMPGWKRDLGRRLDALIVETVPEVRKAVRWNSPFYGVEGQGWFLGMHCLARYLKIAFFNGAGLAPQPPIASKKEGVRYLHLHEDDPIDEIRLREWIRQAAALPGMNCF